MAAKGIGKLIKGNGPSELAGGPKNLAEEATSKLGDAVTGKAKEKIEDAGGASGHPQGRREERASVRRRRR